MFTHAGGRKTYSDAGPPKRVSFPAKSVSYKNKVTVRIFSADATGKKYGIFPGIFPEIFPGIFPEIFPKKYPESYR